MGVPAEPVLSVVVPGAEEAVILELSRVHREPGGVHPGPGALHRVLGLLHPQFGLADGVLHVGGVDGEEHIVLGEGVPLLKGGGEDLPPHQGGGPEGVVGLDGTGTGDRHSDVPGLGLGGEVGPRDGGGALFGAHGQKPRQKGHDHHDDNEPLDPLLLFLGGLELGGSLGGSPGGRPGSGGLHGGSGS